jgi:EAL domain-containing protein (putative c-di-GMP-specific phosphodiesterase class I)/GGDEF domain-containing protein
MLRRVLQPHFQPIASLAEAMVMGYESLIRGPSGSELARPDRLFAAAHAEGCALDLELYCFRAAVCEFVRSGAKGQLFVNLSAEALLALPAKDLGDMASFSRRFGLLPSQITIELTEHTRVRSNAELAAAFSPLREAGVKLALDDFGDGHSSLRSWTELEPDFVKVDKHFVQGIHASNRQLDIMRVYLFVSERFGGALIAEGIEAHEDLKVLRDLGIGFGQGYLLGRPEALPSGVIPAPIVEALRSRKVAVLPEIREASKSAATIESLLIEVEAASPDTSCAEVEERFYSGPSAPHAIAVVDAGRPIGLLNRVAFINAIGRPFYRELFGRKSCTILMNTSPSIVDRTTPLHEMFELVKGEDQRYLTDGFVLTDRGEYLGLATGERFIRALTEYRVEAARHANPLTSLPGNIPISAHIARLLGRESRFAVCYFDLRNFKPFNDVYGYWRGDEMIRLLAGTLVTHTDRQLDFVGRVGGDDFVVVFQSENWLVICERILAEFNDRARSLYDEGDRAAGHIMSEDRAGNPCAFPLITVVVGAVIVDGEAFDRPEQVASAAADAKRIAKHKVNGMHVVRHGDGIGNAAEIGAGTSAAVRELRAVS